MRMFFFDSPGSESLEYLEEMRPATIVCSPGDELDWALGLDYKPDVVLIAPPTADIDDDDLLESLADIVIVTAGGKGWDEEALERVEPGDVCVVRWNDSPRATALVETLLSTQAIVLDLDDDFIQIISADAAEEEDEEDEPEVHPLDAAIQEVIHQMVEIITAQVLTAIKTEERQARRGRGRRG